MKREKSCGAVLFCLKEGRYYTLLVKHTLGHWGFPKGHQDPEDIDEEATAKREIKEETGLIVDLDTGFRKTSTYSPSNDVYKQVVYFVGKPQSGTAQPDLKEIEEVKWVSFTEALALLSYQSDMDILEAAEEYLRGVESDN